MKMSRVWRLPVLPAPFVWGSLGVRGLLRWIDAEEEEDDDREDQEVLQTSVSNTFLEDVVREND